MAPSLAMLPSGGGQLASAVPVELIEVPHGHEAVSMAFFSTPKIGRMYSRW